MLKETTTLEVGYSFFHSMFFFFFLHINGARFNIVSTGIKAISLMETTVSSAKLALEVNKLREQVTKMMQLFEQITTIVQQMQEKRKSNQN